MPEHTSPVPVVAHHAEPKPAPVAERVGTGVKLAKISKVGDQVFRGMAGGSGLFIVLLVVFVGVFLLALALPSLLRNQDNFLTSRNWVVAGNELSFGIAGLLWTTVLTSIVAMVIAVPVAVGVALFLTQYLHKRASGPLSFVVDLLAAVPSIIFGLWGLTVLGPFLTPVGDWLIDNLGFIPLFEAGVTVKSSVFVAGVVLAIMILPIVTAISRDVFAQTPRDHIEAALALGATRWEMIRTAVLPYGRSGVISASMLGLGRALGETIAVMIILTTPAPGSDVQPVDLRRRGDLRQQDRQQRGRVRQPVQDRSLHRRRPGAVRGDLHRQRHGPDHRREREPRSHDRTTTSTSTPTGQPLSFRRPSGPRTIKNALAYVYVTLSAVLAVIPLVWVLYTVITKGIALVTTSTGGCRASAASPRGAEGGGAYHAIVGTIEIGLICAAIAVPIGVLGAILLIEYARGTKVARAVSFTVDILSGIPSIVAALFIYAFFITILGFGRSAIAVSHGPGAVDAARWCCGPPRRCSSWCRTRCARRRTRSACRSGRPSSRWSSRPHSAASPPG